MKNIKLEPNLVRNQRNERSLGEDGVFIRLHFKKS